MHPHSSQNECLMHVEAYNARWVETRIHEDRVHLRLAESRFLSSTPISMKDKGYLLDQLMPERCILMSNCLYGQRIHEICEGCQAQKSPVLGSTHRSHETVSSLR